MKREKPERPGPVVVVQWIEVEWGKDARGAEAATRRNQLPIALSLPELVLKPETRLMMHLWKDGQLQKDGVITQYSDISLDGFPEIELKSSSDHISVTPHPRRVGMGRPAHDIPIQHWSQFTWNERLVYEGSWAYKQITANIGYFHELQGSAFSDQQPLEVWSELVRLY
ncbi:hypothetical protein Q0M94_08770 [Deinococcus radiomollis]|uniref:hypothetical protein n=1 Tax=Deinococcus radiomollis TaxID=468916 RepID=UPI0038922E1B